MGNSKTNARDEVIEFVRKQELDQAQERIGELERKVERLEKENHGLREQLEAARRAGKRQAAPHSRGGVKERPKRPGRKPGKGYGKRYSRAIPASVDEQIEVPLPEKCPHCGECGVEAEREVEQYQEEIVRRKLVRRFRITVGSCRRCGKQVQGRDRRQTSEAGEVGQVQIGPEALALATILNKQMGLSLGHTQQVLWYGYGVKWSRGGLCRAMARVGRKAEPSYQGLLVAARQAVVNTGDETGWKVAGVPRWMHVAVSEQVTVYAILPGRGFEQMKALLGAGYDGFLVHDGWAAYYRFETAMHQSCLRHLLVRCAEMASVASPSAAGFPLAVKGLLEGSLRLRDRFQEGELSEHGMRSATGRVEAQLDRMLDKNYRNPANQKLAKHLGHEQPHLFTFLRCPGLPATNHLAEQAVRWMVIARKVWGGNRTWAGAQTQHTLVSILRTYWQQDKDPFLGLVELQRSPVPLLLEIVPGADSIRADLPEVK